MRAGWKYCLACSAPNDRKNELCEKCAAPFPDLDATPVQAGWKTCKACGAFNTSLDVRCSSCAVAFRFVDPKSPEAKRKHSTVMGISFAVCAILFLLAAYYGISNGTVYNFTYGSMRYPAAGWYSMVLTVIMTLGIGTFVLAWELARSIRAYRRARANDRDSSQNTA